MNLADIRRRHIRRARRWSAYTSRPRYTGRAGGAERPRYTGWHSYYGRTPARPASSIIALFSFMVILTAAAYILSKGGFSPGGALRADRFDQLDRFLAGRLAFIRGVLPALSSRPVEAHEARPPGRELARLFSDIIGFDAANIRSFLSLPGGDVLSSRAALPAVSKTTHPGDVAPPFQGGKMEEARPSVGPVRVPTPPAEPELPRQQPALPRRSPGPPVIAIYHSHTSEAYRPTSGQDYVWGRDEGVVKVGDRLAEVLTKRYGIGVVHSRKIHDYPRWRDAYANSCETVTDILKKYPSIEIVLDIHRDSSTGLSETSTTTEIAGLRVARVFIVVTTDAFGLPHPNWQENLAFARYLQGKMDEMYPGLSRGIDLRQDGRWNQHLHPRAIILEIGSVLNTREEAERAAGFVADVLDQVVRELEIR